MLPATAISGIAKGKHGWAHVWPILTIPIHVN